MHEEAAGRERLLRNQIVKTLRTEDPKKWTYGALADAVGCSEELIRKIISPQRRGRTAAESGHDETAPTA